MRDTMTLVAAGIPCWGGSRLRAGRALTWLAPLALVACGGSGSDDGFELPPDFGEPVAVTSVVAATVPAGGSPAVECWLIDEEDRQAPVPGEFAEVDFAPGDAFADGPQDDEPIAVRAGDATARCRVPTLGLVEDEPSEFQIVAGPPHRVVTTVDRERIVAGESIAAACEVWDAWDNPIDDVAARLAVDPATAGMAIDGRSATVRQAGDYTAVCEVPGAGDLQGAPFTVDPDLPSTLLIARDPERIVYGQQEMVQLDTHALDRFGNEVPVAMVGFTVFDGVLSAGDGEFQMPNCGSPPCTARVRATLTGSTYMDQEVSVTVPFTVQGDGPRIRCLGPGDASMIDWPPGGTRFFAGQVPGEPAWVTVNGEPVTVGTDGRFETEVPVRFGMNFVDVESEDAFGTVNSRTCTFLLANQWAPEHGFFNDSVSLALGQGAVDDGDRTDLDSLADAVDRLVHSDGLREALENALRERNPLVDWRKCFVLCVSARVNYVEDSLHIDGPHGVAMTLVDDGLRVRLDVRNAGLRISLAGTCNGTVTVDLPRLIIDATLDLRAFAGLPRVTVREVHEVSAPGFDVDASLGGFCSILNPILSLIDAFFSERRHLEAFARSFLEEGVDRMLADVIGSLGVREIGASFDVPRFDGTGTLPLDFALRLSSMDAQPGRLLIGTGTQIRPGTFTRGRSSLGVPLPPGPVLHDPAVDATRTAAVAAHVALVNQVLHALWRGGFFDADLDALVPIDIDLPEGAEATLRMRLPPVATLRADGRMEIQIGSLQARVVVPGVELIEDGMELDFGLVASAPLLFDPSTPHVGIGAIDAEEISVSTPTLDNVPQAARDEAQDLLLKAAQLALDVAVNDALPAFPIPSFTFGESLEPFDLSGTLGLVDPTLETWPPHYVFRSGFGIMP
jgi:hypothetical protein